MLRPTEICRAFLRLARGVQFRAAHFIRLVEQPTRWMRSREALNRFLLRYALPTQQAGSSQTYIAVAGEVETAGYSTLVVGAVSYEDAPEPLKKGLARHPVPLMVLARMAVAVPWQGRGLEASLLKDAMKCTVEAADIAGIRALAVHAKDEKAAAFYRHLHFAPSPTDPVHLYLLVKDIAAFLR